MKLFRKGLVLLVAIGGTGFLSDLSGSSDFSGVNGGK